MNSVSDILNEAVKLKPKDRALLIEGLVKSIDEPDKILDQIWLDEAESRLRSHREGKSKDCSSRYIFGEEI
jgi:putative addiction module component (TIGR02574 family)